jgi:hypothetical protein
MGGVHLTGSERILAFAAGVRVGAGRREHLGRVECILDCAGSADVGRCDFYVCSLVSNITMNMHTRGA